MSMVKNLANKLEVQLGLNKFKTKGDLEFEKLLESQRHEIENAL